MPPVFCAAQAHTATPPGKRNKTIILMTRLLLIDAYALIYRSYFAMRDHPFVNSQGVNTSAVFGFCNVLQELLRTYKPTHCAVVFDCKEPTFRHEMFAQYKAQRDAAPKEIHEAVPRVKEILEALHIPHFEMPGFEADDVMCSIARQMEKEADEVLLATPDKDYAQAVSDRIHLLRPNFRAGYTLLDKASVMEKYHLQSPRQMIAYLSLLGDAADNVPGCRGIGEKSAQKILEKFADIADIYRRIDEVEPKFRPKLLLGKSDVLLAEKLVTIRQDLKQDITLLDLLRQEPDKEKLAAIFKELEFRTMITKFVNNSEKTAKTRKAAPPTSVKGQKNAACNEEMLAEIAPEGAGVSKNSQDFIVEQAPKPTQVPLYQGDKRLIWGKVKSAEKVSFFPVFSSQEPMLAHLTAFALFWGVEGAVVNIPKRETDLFGFNDEKPTDEMDLSDISDLIAQLFGDEKLIKCVYNMKPLSIVLSRQFHVEVNGGFEDVMLEHYVLKSEVTHDFKTIAFSLLHEDVEGDPLLAAYAVYKAHERLLEQLKEERLESVYRNIELPLVPVLRDMEMAGVRVDVNAMKEASERLQKEAQEVEQEVYRMAGKKFNIASPKQVGEVLFDDMRLMEKPKKTRSGQYSTSEEVLLKLRGKHKIVGLILDLRGIRKLLNTYIDALPRMTNPTTGRIHTTFNQAVAATGRLSSSNPNLQNIPVHSPEGRLIRQAFVPYKGEGFLSADYSQIELRIMAHLSQDEHMLEAFRNGEDVHQRTAAKIYRKPFAEVTKEERSRAKRANFGIIYGITSWGLQEQLGITRDEAKSLIDGYFENFPAVREYIEKQKEEARKTLLVRTITGRKRDLPDILSHNSTVRSFAERNAVNAPIQGSASDIIKVAMRRIWERMRSKKLRSTMLLQVHDELCFSVPQEEAREMMKLVKEEMENAAHLTVPLSVECQMGESWLAAH